MRNGRVSVELMMDLGRTSSRQRSSDLEGKLYFPYNETLAMFCCGIHESMSVSFIRRRERRLGAEMEFFFTVQGFNVLLLNRSIVQMHASQSKWLRDNFLMIFFPCCVSSPLSRQCGRSISERITDDVHRVDESIHTLRRTLLLPGG